MALFDRLRRRMNGLLVPGGLFRRRFSLQNDTRASDETIFSAVSMLSGAMGSLPVALRRDSTRVTADGHPVAWLLERGPNPTTTTFAFLRDMETLRDSTGAGYAVKELDASGRVTALWLMKTERVRPVTDPDTRELYYHVRDHLSGEEVFLHSSLVIAVTHIGVDGEPVNPIAVLRSSLDYDREVKEFSVNQMQNGLHASLAIKFPNAMGPDQIDEYSERMRRFRKSGVLYLDSRQEVQQLTGSSVIDPKVFEVENITIARVARVFNIPLEKFLPEKTSYSSAEQSDLNYLRDTILPMVRMYEQEFNAKLLTEQERTGGLRIKFSLNGFARADMETRGKFYMQGIRSSWFCPDEVRALEDLPPLPGGQGREFYISKDLIPVSMLHELYQTKGVKDP